VGRPIADAIRVTRRAWIMLAVGLAAAASLGGFALASRGSATVSEPSPSWGVFSKAAWRTVSQRATVLGFSSASVKVVTAMPKQNGTPFALLSATSSAGRTCFIPVRNVSLGRPICRLTKPLVIFTMSDRFQSGTAATVPATLIIGLARHDIISVVATETSNGRPFVQGEPLLPAAGASAFGGGFESISQLVARNAAGHVVATLRITRPGH